MRVVEARGLPDNPTDAANAFGRLAVPAVRDAIAAGAGAVCVVFDQADHTHTAWRRAAVQSLAREAAPARVNAVAGGDVAAGLAYLGRAAGVTGQYLPLDARGGGDSTRTSP